MNCVFSQLFVMEFSMGLGPCKFAGVVLGFKMTMALGPAETKCLAVIANEHDPMTRVDWTGAEVAALNTHQQSILYSLNPNSIKEL